MSLYYEAASLLDSGQLGSLKSRVFGSQALKSPPTQTFALLTEAVKWSQLLSEAIDESGLLQREKKLSPSLALLLVHDLLLSRKGVAAPANHPLRLAVSKHKARLNAELTKARLKRRFASIETCRRHLNHTTIGLDLSESDDMLSMLGMEPRARRWAHPKWIRINTIKTSLSDQLATTFKEHTIVDSLDKMLLGLEAKGRNKLLYIDKHIPDLVAVPSNSNVAESGAYHEGNIIFQDKASCFPAYLLAARKDGADCLDACAAPGNKTTHLAALTQRLNHAKRITIFACERDKDRALTLQKMVCKAGADDVVSIRPGQDFLKLDPGQPPWNTIGAILLDPSCTGSGIVGRGEAVSVTLPRTPGPIAATSNSRKRKRKRNNAKYSEAEEWDREAGILSDQLDHAANLQRRLEALSYFQLKLLNHAFMFPSASRVVYSTCSLHVEENEHVVTKALQSPEALSRGWRIMTKAEQPSGLRLWQLRGNLSACMAVANEEIERLFIDKIATACIRCNKKDAEGTQGFFVAGFVRSGNPKEPLHPTSRQASVLPAAPIMEPLGVCSDSEWEGLSDRIEQ